MKVRAPLCVILAALFLGGCATVKRPFVAMKPDYTALPAEALRELARGIEREISKGNRDATFENREGLVVDTDEIRQAIRTRAARAHLVDAFLDTGHAWERRNGLLWVLRSSAYKKAGTGKSRNRDALLVMGENNDRWTLYEGILKGSKLPPRALSGIQATFADARIEFLGPGQKYEAESGQVAHAAP